MKMTQEIRKILISSIERMKKLTTSIETQADKIRRGKICVLDWLLIEKLICLLRCDLLDYYQLPSERDITEKLKLGPINHDIKFLSDIAILSDETRRFRELACRIDIVPAKIEEAADELQQKTMEIYDSLIERCNPEDFEPGTLVVRKPIKDDPDWVGIRNASEFPKLCHSCEHGSRLEEHMQKTM